MIDKGKGGLIFLIMVVFASAFPVTFILFEVDSLKMPTKVGLSCLIVALVACMIVVIISRALSPRKEK